MVDLQLAELSTSQKRLQMCGNGVFLTHVNAHLSVACPGFLELHSTTVHLETRYHIAGKIFEVQFLRRDDFSAQK